MCDTKNLISTGTRDRGQARVCALENRRYSSKGRSYPTGRVCPFIMMNNADEINLQIEQMRLFMSNISVVRVRGGMPTAAATHQVVGETDRLNQVPHVYSNEYIFNGVPDAYGQVKLKKLDTFVNTITRGGATLYANCKGTDPSTGNSTIVAQHADRNESCRISILSTIDPACGLYQDVSTADFTTGKHIYDYLHGPDVVYIAPDDDVAADHIKEWKSKTYLDMPVDKQNSDQLCLHFKSFLQSHNPNLHTNFDISEADLVQTYCFGLHPKIKLEANKVRKNPAAYASCCHAANYPAHHPLSGSAHPNSGTISLDKLAIYLNSDFTAKLRAGEFRLKGVPTMGINAVDLSSASDAAVELDDLGFYYMSLNLVGDSNFHDYAINVLNREAAQASRMRTCRNCGGVNHFSHKDGVLICPTPENSVPTNLLRNIRYPFGVNPWKFGGGKGKGKGKGGKGGGRGGGGRGRGGYWVYWQDDVETETPPGDTTEEGQSVDFVVDDYDGFNE